MIRGTIKGSKTEAHPYLNQGRCNKLFIRACGENYLDEALLKKPILSLSIRLLGYPAYPQFHPPFIHEVTILDLLFLLARRPLTISGDGVVKAINNFMILPEAAP